MSINELTSTGDDNFVGKVYSYDSQNYIVIHGYISRIFITNQDLHVPLFVPLS